MNDEHEVLEDVAGTPWASANASDEFIRKTTPGGFPKTIAGHVRPKVARHSLNSANAKSKSRRRMGMK
jgi:hypothetical protein